MTKLIQHYQQIYLHNHSWVSSFSVYLVLQPVNLQQTYDPSVFAHVWDDVQVSFFLAHSQLIPRTSLTYLHILEFLHSACIQFHIPSITGRRMTPRYFHTSEMKYWCQSFCHIHNLSTPQTTLTDLQILEFLHSACTQIHIPSIDGRRKTPRYFHTSEMKYRCQSFCHIHNLSTPQTNLTDLQILEFLHSACTQIHIPSIDDRRKTLGIFTPLRWSTGVNPSATFTTYLPHKQILHTYTFLSFFIQRVSSSTSCQSTTDGRPSVFSHLWDDI